MPARLVAVSEAGRRIGWSLLAANGRQVGRSAARYDSVEELEQGFGELLRLRRSLSFGMRRDGFRAWWWIAFLPTRRPVARSFHGYLRHDQCRKGTYTFISTLDQAPPGGWVLARVVNAR